VLTKVVLNGSGVRELLRSSDVLADLERRAQAIASQAGPHFAVATEIGANRARAVVHSIDYDGALAEAHDRTLTRAIDAGR